MVTVEKVRGARVRIRSVGRLERGDRIEVSKAMATHLVDERGDFAVVERDELVDQWTDEPDEDDPGDEAEESEEFDVMAFVDRTPVEDVAEDILAGEADAYLDAIAEAADRVTVQDAVGERRAALEVGE